MLEATEKPKVLDSRKVMVASRGKHGVETEKETREIHGKIASSKETGSLMNQSTLHITNYRRETASCDRQRATSIDQGTAHIACQLSLPIPLCLL